MNPPFRTIGISNARFEAEGLRCMTVKSKALGHRADLSIFIPRQGAGARDLPVVILLHGVYGSHWDWTLQGGAHRSAVRLIDAGEIPPLVLAMPSDGLWGDGSGYLRHPAGDFERWIVEEVPAAVREAVPEVSVASPLFISGLSMGGFGALRIAGKYPKLFRAGGGHSSITRFEQLGRFVEEPLSQYSCPAEDRSVYETLLRNRGRLPPFRFDCGASDPLLKFSRELAGQLKDVGIPHQYEEFPGSHEWPYWEARLPEMLRFFGGLVR